MGHVEPRAQAAVPVAASGFAFDRGYPTPETASNAYEAADLNRAARAYRFFYPTVSGAAFFKGSAKNGLVPNQVFAAFEPTPKVVGFTYNSDTPYGVMLVELSGSSMVVTLGWLRAIAACAASRAPAARRSRAVDR